MIYNEISLKKIIVQIGDKMLIHTGLRSMFQKVWLKYLCMVWVLLISTKKIKLISKKDIPNLIKFFYQRLNLI